MRLNGRVAIVTGAGSGFGAGIARKFAAEGAKVVVVDINKDAAQEVAIEIGGIAVKADVSNSEDVAAMIETAKDRFGQLDILVNNAGVTHLPGALEEISEEDFDRVFAVNCKSVYLAARAVVPYFKSRNAGVILNVASTAGVSPRPRLNWYNASKGWMITATRTMAVELAQDGIRVNALAPGIIDTAMPADIIAERGDALLARTPLGRFGTADEVAAPIEFLLSDAASFITGQTIAVDGGIVNR